MSKHMIFITLVLLLYPLSLLSASSPEGDVDIPDENLRAVIADSLGKAPDEAITADEMATLTRLKAPNRDIRDLTGLEFATDLRSLNLGNEKVNGKYVNSNAISDLSPLSNLNSLRILDLSDNSISDISPLSNLTINLTFLNLSKNSISDVSPLSNLTHLGSLFLANNSISDVSSLSNLTGLRLLSLSNNSISDVSPLSSLIRLERLFLSNNGLSDISPISDLTNLTLLNLSENAISDVSPLSGLSRLKYLYLRRNSISDLAPLVANKGLRDKDAIDVQNNPLSATSLNTHIPTLQGRGIKVRFSTSI